jgi:glutaredoxin
MLKDYLNEKQVKYIEKSVDSDEKAKEEMSVVSNGFFGVPFIVISKDDGTKETIVGFDKGKINVVLGIQG